MYPRHIETERAVAVTRIKFGIMLMKWSSKLYVRLEANSRCHILPANDRLSWRVSSCGVDCQLLVLRSSVDSLPLMSVTFTARDSGVDSSSDDVKSAVRKVTRIKPLAVVLVAFITGIVTKNPG